MVQNIIEISQLGLPKLKDTKAIDDYIETIKEKTVMVKKEELTKKHWQILLILKQKGANIKRNHSIKRRSNI